jgi:hypothetical protein
MSLLKFGLPFQLGSLGNITQPAYPPPSSNDEAKRKEAIKVEWEKRFSRWRNPPSETEDDKIRRTERMIREAIRTDSFLSSLNLQIVVQGSYKNNTNVRGESDVDICILSHNVISNNLTPNLFKSHLFAVLFDKFGASSIQLGNKSIKIHSNSSRVNADVVAAFFHSEIKGIIIYPEQGAPIINFPLQHYDNGCAKNVRTNYSFKAVVRILKSLNLEMTTSDYKQLPSFLIESLVYNCPDECFRKETLYENVIDTLNFLLKNLAKKSNEVQNLLEVNELKLLFGGGQSWNRIDALKSLIRIQVKILRLP